MSETIFEAFYNTLPSFFLFDILTNVLLALIYGVLIAAIYRYTHNGISYSTDFLITLIIITLVTAVVIMIIGNNLARAFGLVGAMSIIRFRTALKDSRDIAFVFFGLCAGMAAGAGNHLIGLIAVPIIGLIILLLFWTKYGVKEQNEYLLRFWMVPNDIDEPVYESVFKKYLTNFTMLNLRSARLGQVLELAFKVNLKKQDQINTLVNELGMQEGIEKVSIIIGEQNYSDQS